MGVDITSRAFLGMEVQTENFFVEGKPSPGFQALLKEMKLSADSFFEESLGTSLCVITIDGTLIFGKKIAETDTHRGGAGAVKMGFTSISEDAGRIWRAASNIGIPLPWKPLQLWIETRFG